MLKLDLSGKTGLVQCDAGDLRGAMTPKQRMLNAYRGINNDRPAVAPEFWYYYPAKMLGYDMITFERSVPFHLALKETFEYFECEGWGAAFGWPQAADVSVRESEHWLNETTLEVRNRIETPYGVLSSASQGSRDEPSWVTERPLKDLDKDLAAWEHYVFGGDAEALDFSRSVKQWREVGESYLLEYWLGMPFFDTWAGAREGGFETGIYDLMSEELEPILERLRERHTEAMVRLARAVCEHTSFESLCIGCSWSCNSLLGPELWRRWDKPGIAAVAREVHRYGRLLHIHFHGKSMDTVADFAEMEIDCVCPFERPPGGDISGEAGLRAVADALAGKTTMNGNVHTVETLIRGTPDDVRREVAEILSVFKGTARVIVGTGDQVGRETPEANLQAMIEAVKRT